jgi:hypothetical protein
MKKYLLLLLLPLMMLAAHGTAQAQYKNAIGLRLWYYPGLTFKHHFSEPAALELILDSRWGGFIVTGLYEHHFPLGVPNLNLYAGGGAHLGFYNYNSRYDKRWGGYGGGAFLGLDGILGIEYTLDAAPINFSLDYKPAFNFVGYQGFWGDGGALSVRYVF